MRASQEPEVRPPTVEHRPHDASQEGQCKKRRIPDVNARESRSGEQNLEGWRLDEHVEAAVEQPLKCELLGERPERIERKEHQDCWLPDCTPLHQGERDQPGTHNCSADTDRQKTRGEVVTTESQIVPGVGPADREKEDIRTQSQASEKE